MKPGQYICECPPGTKSPLSSAHIKGRFRLTKLLVYIRRRTASSHSAVNRNHRRTHNEDSPAMATAPNAGGAASAKMERVTSKIMNLISYSLKIEREIAQKP